MQTEPTPSGPPRRTPPWLKIGVIVAAVAVIGAGGALAATAGSSGNKTASPPTTAATTTSAPPTTAGSTTTSAPSTTTTSSTTTTAPAGPADAVACANPLPNDITPGTTATMNASLGSTQASMQGTFTDSNGSVKNVTIMVNTAGANPVSDSVPPNGDAGAYNRFGDILPPQGQLTSMCVARVQSKTVVLAALYSDGAHCCTTVYEYPATAPTPPVSKDFGNAPPRLVILNSRLFAQTADNAFAYAFTDYAASGMPIKVLAVTPTGFNDVTRSFPNMISDDAGQWWKAYQSAPKDPLGLLAAWAADECALGQCSSALDKVDQLARSGALDGAPPGQNPRGFPQKLRQFLSTTGYM